VPILLTLLAVATACFLGFLIGFFRLHATMGKHHLRGRKTWAEELEQLDDGYVD
jgi:hypothetical protein